MVPEAKQLQVLIVDGAQHLRNDVLEDLRLLTSSAMNAENRMCLLLAGSTELRRRRGADLHPAVEALFQALHGLPRNVNRIAHHALTAAERGGRCHLPGLNPTSTILFHRIPQTEKTSAWLRETNR